MGSQLACYNVRNKCYHDEVMSDMAAHLLNLTLSRLLDDVWLLVDGLLMCGLRLLVVGLHGSLGEGIALSCKANLSNTFSLHNTFSPVFAPDTTVVVSFSFLSSPNSSTSSAVGFTLSVLSDSDLRGLLTCLTPPT